LQGSCQYSNSASGKYREGCFAKVENWVEDHSAAVLGVSIAVMVIMVSSFTCYCSKVNDVYFLSQLLNFLIATYMCACADKMEQDRQDVRRPRRGKYQSPRPGY